MKKLILVLLIILLMILKQFGHPERIVDFQELINPTSVIVDDSRIYFADGTSVLIYSLDHFGFINQFGNEGDGPGEFKIAPNLPITIHLNKGNLVVTSLGKISTYTKQGKFLKEVRNKTLAINLIPWNNRYVGKGFAQSEGRLYLTVNMYNEQLEKIREIYREQASFQRGTNQKFDPIDATGPGIAISPNHLFLNIGENRNTIAAFDAEGSRSFSFTHEFREIELTGEHITRYMEYLEKDPNFRNFVARTKHLFKFKKLFPLVQNFHIDGDKILVTSYENEFGVRDLYVFTLKGEFIAQTEAPLVSQNVDAPYPFTISAGKIFQIVEDEDGESWALFIHNLELSSS